MAKWSVSKDPSGGFALIRCTVVYARAGVESGLEEIAERCNATEGLKDPSEIPSLIDAALFALGGLSIAAKQDRAFESHRDVLKSALSKLAKLKKV